MENMYILIVAALIPTVVGFIYYHEKLVGKAWMEVTGMTTEKARSANMPLMMVIGLALSVALSFLLSSFVIHQNGLNSLFFGAEGEALEMYNAAKAMSVDYHRSFGHGALHGFVFGLFGAFPILATNAMFEQKGWKYIWINSGYWIITLTLMGGVICQFG
jgi:hypothetical protein